MRAQEFVKPHQMAKLEKTGRIVEILRHQDQVDFSDEPGWYLINLEPGKRVAPDMKWIPDSTRFEWVREFKRADAVAEDSFDGIDVTMERDADEITVRAAAGGKQLGHVLFVQDGDALLPQDLEVDERYQGQGIAKVMYDYVKSLGYQIRRSGQQTAAGAGFWGKHRPAQNVWEQGVAEGESNDTAISLSKLGKFHPGADTLAEFVPERATAQYALHPDKWESTFYSLTNKDSDKLKYYGPKKISIPPGTLVGDMAIANKFYRAKTTEEKQQYAEAYKASLQPYPVDVSKYRMPELLIPKQGVAENFADGKGPGRPGDSVRHGIPKGATMAELERASHSKGRKGQLARWQLNMRRGHKK